MARMDRRHFVGLAALSGVATVTAGMLGGCGSSRSESTSESDETPATASADATGATSAADPAPSDGNAIVIVFSWSGNTLQVAERVAADARCELFRIEPAEPYTTDYDEMLQIAKDEQAADALPVLAATVPNWDSYGRIYLGFPTWWGHLPQVVKSFAAEHDCSSKVVYPFNTHAGSGFASTLSDLEAAFPDADIREGLSIPGNSVSASTDQIDAWVQASL